MKNILFASLLALSFSAVADEEEVDPQDVEATSIEADPTDTELPPSMATPAVAPAIAVVNGDIKEEDKVFNHRQSHWVGTYVFENLKYEVPYSYTGGVKRRFKEEKQDLWGARVGFGREAYLGAGFIFGARLDGYYLGTVFQDDKVAKNTAGTASVSTEKNTGQMYGADAVGHLGWMFDYQTKNPFLGEMTYMAMELFVEAGIGRGKAYNSKNYYFDAGTREFYKFIMEDEFTTQSVSAGMNILSVSSGFFLSLRATRMVQDVTKRRVRTQSQDSGGALGAASDTTFKSAKTDPINVFSLGGGYKF